ncbi:BatD family protein [Capnocytophaga sp.]|uniref:BatD family protein n=1 Tax=Capnocytophaga sp. TaxID=44737 RepID=UPI0026DC7E0B|nr:BatD family protein [Capnocytophaga sp.]MDO5105492.1 BatD family protein [Capnocytophaga sp.]
MKYRILFFISFVINLLHSQNVEFTAKVSKETLGVNERLRIEFTMNENGDNFTPPNFKNFTVVMGPSQSVSESWINGTRKFSKTYGYILQPNAKGKFTIGQASIEIKGKTYKTATVQITVTEAVSTPSIDKTSNDVARDNLFLVAEVSKPNPFLNEAVSVVYRLYVGGQVALNDLRLVDIPKFPNFWSQEIRMQNYEIENCTHNGKPFRCIVVKKVVLYPQKTGNITLEPLSLDAILSVPTAQRDFFGRPVMEQVSKRVSAGTKTLNIRDLPQQGKPDNFSGAVGEFSFNVTTSKRELKANESLQAKVEISGSGNLKLFDIPKLTFPTALEVYNPEKKDDINTSLSGMRGRVEEFYTVVPQFKGKYPIAGISFSYFNPRTEKYETLKSNEIWIDVTEGPTGGNLRNPSENIVKQDVITQANQFRFLQLNADLQPANQKMFFGSTRYYLWLLLPLLIIPISLIFWKNRQKRAGDIEGNKARTANRLAKKYLGEAKQKLGDKNTFYEALERALHNYLKAKLKIETSEMSKENISDLLLQRNASQQTVSEFLGLLKNCEMARYSPFDTVSMENDYQKSVQILSELDKQIKK